MKIRKYLPVIVLSYLLFFMIAFVTGLQNPLGAILMSQYDVSVGVAQLGNFANFIAYFCMGIPAGLMLKKYGYKFSLLVAATVGIIGIGLMFFSGQISRGLWLYFTGAFVAGFSMCMLNAVVNPLLNSLGGGGKKGNQLIQWGGSLNSIAATIVPFVVGFLMGRSAGALAAGEHPHFEIADVNPMFIILVSIFAVAILAILFVDIPEAETFETDYTTILNKFTTSDSIDTVYCYKEDDGGLAFKVFKINKRLVIRRFGIECTAKWNATIKYDSNGYLEYEKFETMNVGTDPDSKTVYGECVYTFN